MSDFAPVLTEINELKKSLESGYVSKASLQKVSDQVIELERSMQLRTLEARKHPVFGNEAVANQAAEWAAHTLVKSWRQSRGGLGVSKDLNDLLTKTPQDLSQYVNSAGGYTVPTAVYPVLEQLFLQAGMARRAATWIQFAGKMQVTSATDQGTATFTGAPSNAPNDDVAINQTTLPQSAVTLAPSPLSAIYYVSRQLLYNTGVNLTAAIMQNLAQANTLAEDVTSIWGDGTATYAGNYGFNNVSGVNKVTTNSAGKTFIPLSQTPASGEALPTLDDLINLTTVPQETAALEDDCAFYMHRQVAAYFRTLKASTSGLYFLDPVVNPINTPIGRPAFMFAGYPVYIWNRMSSGQLSTGKVVLSQDNAGAFHWSTTSIPNAEAVPLVAFGSMKKATLFGTNREYAIETSTDFKFSSDLLSVKGREDYGTSFPYPQALAVLQCSGFSS